MHIAHAARPADPEALFSSHWYRVAGLRARLRPQVGLRQHVQRGVAWTVLVNAYGDEAHRLNRPAYEFIGRCDGRATVDAVWQSLLDQAPEQALSQDEALRLLAQLHEAQLIEFDVPTDVEDVFGRQAGRRRKQRWSGVNPLAFKMTLLDPSRWIGAFDGVAARLFSPAGLVIWCLLVTAAMLAALPEASALAAHAQQLAGSTGGLALAWLVYPPLKAVHELAHGLALRRFGVTPRRAGVHLLLLTPVPFVDASGADGLRHRHQRAIVSAAGIAAELALAALALFVWLAVEPGRVRDLALGVMTIGALSTLLVNGNPLMRFDGYFVACDLLELRNLATRSTGWWALAWRRRVLGDRSQPPMECLPGERGWLVAYGPLALLCRLVLGVGATLWAGSLSTPLGAVVGTLVGWSLVGRPLLALGRLLRQRPQAGVRGRAGVLALALAALLLLPLPHRLVVRGVVLPAEQSQVRAGADGFVAEWLVAHGRQVEAGQLLGRLSDDDLVATRATLAAQVAELDVQAFEAQTSAPTEAPALREKLAFSRAELQRSEDRLAALLLVAPESGTLVLPGQADLVGRYQTRGQLLGYVKGHQPAVLRAAVPQEDAALLPPAPHDVDVVLASAPTQVLPGRLVRQGPAAIARLPAAALGERAGGDIATDPQDPEGLVPRASVVVLDVALPEGAPSHMGERASVRLALPDSALAQRLARSLRQLVLGHFNASN